jgi:hypothetical protein
MSTRYPVVAVPTMPLTSVGSPSFLIDFSGDAAQNTFGNSGLDAILRRAAPIAMCTRQCLPLSAARRRSADVAGTRLERRVLHGRSRPSFSRPLGARRALPQIGR